MTRNPATYACENCSRKYPMGKETTIYLYLKQPWFNHIEVHCPAGCKQTYYVWNLMEATIRFMETNNMSAKDPINWSVTDFAPDPIVRRFCCDNNKPYPKKLWISPRRTAYIDVQSAEFAETLANISSKDIAMELE